MKVRMADSNPEMIEFNIELAPVANYNNQPNDLTMNWKMLSGFDMGKTFWTDENGLEMTPRKLENNNNATQSSISNNFVPVTSAIAVRDQRAGSNIQITVMNDRTQAGSAGNSDGNTIELMQHRRIPTVDRKSPNLDEMNSWNDKGIKVNARYFMQIFDTKLGHSLQRQQ